VTILSSLFSIDPLNKAYKLWQKIKAAMSVSIAVRILVNGLGSVRIAGNGTV
tara:strand:+ start:542 stop:697 length:156 start_codon:yes stop_codon:yes gene_type:complete